MLMNQRPNDQKIWAIRQSKNIPYHHRLIKSDQLGEPRKRRWWRQGLASREAETLLAIMKKTQRTENSETLVIPSPTGWTGTEKVEMGTMHPENQMARRKETTAVAKILNTESVNKPKWSTEKQNPGRRKWQANKFLDNKQWYEGTHLSGWLGK